MYIPWDEARRMGTLSSPTIMGKPWFIGRSGESGSLRNSTILVIATHRGPYKLRRSSVQRRILQTRNSMEVGRIQDASG